jgi:MFS family permease
MSTEVADQAAAPKSPLNEIVQPFIDVARAPRALWGINLAYLIEGMVYFGMLNYLAMYFNEYVGLDDVWAGRMVGVLTAGITISMFFFGGLADRWGVRVAILGAFALMLVGRSVLALGPTIGLAPSGLGAPIQFLALGGILLVVLGYGMYQPAAYSAVRQFTTPATAGMGYAMLYALMNLGGWLPSFMSPVRNRVGIDGAYWVYVAFTGIALVTTAIILTRRTVGRAIADAQAKSGKKEQPRVEQDGRLASNVYCFKCGYNLRGLAPEGLCPECAAQVLDSLPAGIRTCPNCARKQRQSEGQNCTVCGTLLPPAPPMTAGSAETVGAQREPFSIIRWLKAHPLADPKFAFFIFCLIPVQTLFAHNWLTLPMYVERAYRGSWIGTNFEVATNFNPLLIFFLVPIVTALTQKRKVYNMMIIGTLVMAAPTFLLTLGPSLGTLAGYLIIMTLGEAMWQPRFLQYAAEIAPEGRTGAYMGVAQFPWFMTKMIVPFYSGWFLQNYCPQEGATNTQSMWLIYGCIAMATPLLLVLAKGWVGRDFKAQAAAA